MTSLVRYDAARHALQVAHSVDEVKDIRDKAQAMAAYARQANDTAMVEWATEIKVRAERRAGEMLVAMPKHNGDPLSHDVTRLSDLGVSRMQSSRWQKLAAVPEEKFEQAVAAAKEVAHEVTTAAMLRLSGAPHVSHNSGENEWYTPPDIIERARRAMGGIDVDPASSDTANAAVLAAEYFTAEKDGLSQRWWGRIWMNPPYAQPLCASFCELLTVRYEQREISQACLLVNNATETTWFQPMLSVMSAICFPKGRIKFVDQTGEPSGAPLQGQAILYFGGRADEFKREFEPIGAVLSHA